MLGMASYFFYSKLKKYEDQKPNGEHLLLALIWPISWSWIIIVSFLGLMKYIKNNWF